MLNIGEPFIILESVDSTNNYAMAQTYAGLARHGTAYFSWEQTAGKGQRGKTWRTGKGENIILSIVLQTGNFLLSDQFLLSATIALSCYDLVKVYAGEETKIKWPNDIYWRDRKAGGILIENVLKGHEWQYAVVGIGLNINQTVFSEDIPNPVSLRQVSGKTYDLLKLSKELCSLLQKRFTNLENHPEKVIDEYNTVLYKQGEKVKLRHGSILFEALIKRVSKQGQLLVQRAAEQAFNAGEIEWVL